MIEKINLTNNSNSLISKPDWLRVKAPQVERIGNTANLLNDLNLNTVCQEASCPNIGECFASGTATFLIMGPGCTRACPYCDIDFDRSKRVTGTLALHRCAAIPLPIVPDPMMTTLLICIYFLSI